MSNFTKLMQQAAAGNVGGDFYPYTIDNSVRFNSGDSPVLTRTPSNTSSTQWTLSFWCKLADVGTELPIVSAGTADGNEDLILIQGAGYLYYRYGSSSNFHGDYSVLYRDPSAWYHIVLKWDSANATSTDRLAWYVNGNLAPMQSGDTNYPTLNQSTRFTNSSFTTYIGEFARTSVHLDAYLSQFAFVDGQALDPTDFAESKNGVWVPKDISGLTYGTNGYLLDFADSSNLGNDVSGNNNDFTSSGLTSSDQMPDTPTNNFMTAPMLVPRVTGGSSYVPSTAEGNLQVITANSQGMMSQGFPQSGKWYFEVTCRNTYPAGGYDAYYGVAIGTVSSDVSQVGVNAETQLIYFIYAGGSTSRLLNGGSWITTGNVSGTSGALTNGDIIAFAIDMDNGVIDSYVNNVKDHSITLTATEFASKDVRVSLGGDGSPTYGNTIGDINFGQNGSFNGFKTAQGNSDENGIGDFYYTPPSGYLAVCSQNMPEPTIGPNSATTSGENFDTALWTGTGTTQNITSLGFQPDFVWMKNRDDATQQHWLFDAVRGTGNLLLSSSNSAELSYPTILSSFNSNGFTTDSNGSYGTGDDFVAWNWKANGSGSSNTDGSITSTVSANTDAGISVVSYTGNGSNSQTVGHGLGASPDVVILKDRDTNSISNRWTIFHSALPTQNGEFTNSAFFTFQSRGSITAVSSSTFTLYGSTDTATVNESGDGYIAYCFAEVDGFSKFGSFQGNGNSDGPFIFTGMRPAWVLIKNTSASNSWLLYDTKRIGYNQSNNYLLPDLSNAEGSGDNYIDILSNGFKVRVGAQSINTSGNNYIYMCFSENPFKYSNAR